MSSDRLADDLSASGSNGVSRLFWSLLLVCPSSAHDLHATCLAVHIRVGPLRRFCELTVFDARLYIRVRRVDQPA